MWWVLDEPTEDLAVAREMERRLAVWLNGDKSIVNPSRVMRLGGSVAWPLKAGRKVEVTDLITKSARQAPWGFDELKVAVREAVPLEDETARPSDPMDFNTADRQGGPGILQRINKALDGDHWHDNVRDAVAHAIARGTPADIVVDLMAPLVVRAGYTVEETRRDIATMARGALVRGFAPDPEKPEKPVGHGLAGQWIDDIAYAYEPELIEGLIPSNGVGVIYGPSSAGKSFVTVDWAMRIASGGRVLGRFTEASGVLYFAAEGQGGLRKRLVAARQAHGMDEAVIPLNYLPALLDLSKAETGDVERLCLYAEDVAREMKDRGAPLRIVVVDTLAAAAPSADENMQKDMGPIMLAFHRMANRLGAVVLLVAHTGKDVARGLRGWSGIRANADFAIECRVDKDEDTGETSRRSLWLEKAKDGRDGFTLSDYALRVVEMGTKRSGEPDTTCRVEYVAPAPVTAAQGPAKAVFTGAYKTIMDMLENDPKTTMEVAAELSIDRSNAFKKLRALERDGAVLARQDGNRSIWIVCNNGLHSDTEQNQ
jgi:KaiC/GvpD/RAD55 family RecA-like ATPase